MKQFALVALAAAVLAGCEDNQVIEDYDEYREVTLVESFLEAGARYRGVRITRALPFGASLDSAAAEDAEPYLVLDGGKTIPLHYRGEGWYVPLQSVRIESGMTCELLARRNGKLIYARTVVPEAPEIAEAEYNAEGYLVASLDPQDEFAYAAVWAYVNDEGEAIRLGENFYDVYRPRTDEERRALTVRTETVPLEYRAAGVLPYIGVTAYAFDAAYEAYFASAQNHALVADAYTQGGGAVEWNVVGEDAAGLFVGYAVAKPEKP
jgi:hypothetical protein